ncbi:hypothetical protein [Lysinibacillus fusiformis]|uniref:hypothetical protein n=1 Tax=Lysinibacillus fusiformis TaxID=28031 RepID=UPI0021C0CDD2|nr:hypothetical protein [Lysinibacillus fusiformis]UXJ71291.1 hypothetical protein N5069_23940 [Lysinibacillus fusiformis]
MKKQQLLTSKVFAFWSVSTILFALVAKVTFDSNVGNELTLKQWVSFISAIFCVIILCLPFVIPMIIIIIKSIESLLKK